MSLILDKIRTLSQAVFKSEKPQPLPFPEVLNIESSYACNLKCMMCPRHFDDVPQGMFTLEMFEKHIEPYIHRFKYVHLMGWGEPLMNRDLPEIVRRSVAKGVHTCFTSNGLLLKSPLDRKILETGLHSLNISCDADNAVTYEEVRGKGTFDILIERLRKFKTLREEMDSKTRMLWIFVMMRNNFEQLPGAIRLAKECGFHQVGAKHMETAINRMDLSNAMWNTGFAPDVPAEVIARHDEVIEESIRVAKELDIELFIHKRRMDHEGMCLVKPATNLFVDFEGKLSGCAYQNIHSVRPYNTEQEMRFDTGVIGDLRLGDLMDFLDSARYQAYRREWLEGGVPEACRNCLQIQRLHTTSSDDRHGCPDRV